MISTSKEYYAYSPLVKELGEAERKGSGVRDMKITIKAEPKEIAALVVAIQERTVLSDNLIVERDSLITVPEGICEPKFQNKS